MRRTLKTFLTTLMVISIAITGAFAAPVSYGSELTNMPNKSYNQIFNDVPKTYWAFDYISEMNTRHVLSGYPNGYFYPDNYVTRGEFAKIMTLAAGMDVTDPTYSNYVDVTIDDWYCPYIETARYYLSGYSNGETTFYLPNDNALREDIAVALVKLKGYSTTGFDLSILKAMFTDWQSISDGAQKYVATAVEKGLISGYEDGTFRGQDGVTRAETATLLWRAYQYGNGNKNFEQVTKEVLPEPTAAPTLKPEPTIEPKPTQTPKPTETPDVVEKETKVEPEETQEPESNYTWRVTTLKSDSYAPASMVAVPNGVAFMDEDGYVYEVDGNTGKRIGIFNPTEFPYKGEEEISKRETIVNEVASFNYNWYDNCYYVVLNQDPGNRDILYNVTNDEVIYNQKRGYQENMIIVGCTDKYRATTPNNQNTTNPFLQFLKNGDFIYGGMSKISNNGKIVDFHYRNQDNLMVCDNKLFLFRNNLLSLCDNGKEYIDCDKFLYNDNKGFICAKDKFIFYDENEKEIRSLNTNGDVNFFMNLEDIDNPEGRDIRISDMIGNGCITRDENTIYFYDSSYGSLRKIEHLR